MLHPRNDNGEVAFPVSAMFSKYTCSYIVKSIYFSKETVSKSPYYLLEIQNLSQREEEMVKRVGDC